MSDPGATGDSARGTGPARRYLLTVRRTGPAGSELVALEVLAGDAGLHPDMVGRLIALGAVEPAGGTALAPLFPRESAARLARITRLRRDLGLNYAGALLACDLLQRIEALEGRQPRFVPRPGGE